MLFSCDAEQTKDKEYAKLNELFFLQATLSLAQSLIGCLLVVRDENEDRRSGIIVETEAYHSVGDAASHSFKGRTVGNAAMFEAPGTLYVYLIYGMYHCINIVSENSGIGAAVLIRALKPCEGIEVMEKEWTRHNQRIKMINLCRGPGRLSKALGLNRNDNNLSLINSDRIWLEEPPLDPTLKIVATPRIGINRAKDLPWRFLADESHNYHLWASRQ